MTKNEFLFGITKKLSGIAFAGGTDRQMLPYCDYRESDGEVVCKVDSFKDIIKQGLEKYLEIYTEEKEIGFFEDLKVLEIDPQKNLNPIDKIKSKIKGKHYFVKNKNPNLSEETLLEYIVFLRKELVNFFLLNQIGFEEDNTASFMFFDNDWSFELVGMEFGQRLNLSYNMLSLKLVDTIDISVNDLHNFFSNEEHFQKANPEIPLSDQYVKTIRGKLSDWSKQNSSISASQKELLIGLNPFWLFLRAILSGKYHLLCAAYDVVELLYDDSKKLYFVENIQGKGKICENDKIPIIIGQKFDFGDNSTQTPKFCGFFTSVTTIPAYFSRNLRKYFEIDAIFEENTIVGVIDNLSEQDVIVKYQAKIGQIEEADELLNAIIEFRSWFISTVFEGKKKHPERKIILKDIESAELANSGGTSQLFPPEKNAQSSGGFGCSTSINYNELEIGYGSELFKIMDITSLTPQDLLDSYEPVVGEAAPKLYSSTENPNDYYEKNEYKQEIAVQNALSNWVNIQPYQSELLGFEIYSTLSPFWMIIHELAHSSKKEKDDTSTDGPIYLVNKFRRAFHLPKRLRWAYGYKYPAGDDSDSIRIIILFSENKFAGVITY